MLIHVNTILSVVYMLVGNVLGCFLHRKTVKFPAIDYMWIIASPCNHFDVIQQILAWLPRVNLVCSTYLNASLLHRTLKYKYTFTYKRMFLYCGDTSTTTYIWDFTINNKIIIIIIIDIQRESIRDGREANGRLQHTNWDTQKPRQY